MRINFQKVYNWIKQKIWTKNEKYKLTVSHSIPICISIQTDTKIKEIKTKLNYNDKSKSDLAAVFVPI